MHLELDLFSHFHAAAFETHSSRVLVIAPTVVFQKDDTPRLVVPSVFHLRHRAASHLVHKFGKPFIIRKVYIIAPQIVEVFGERFFRES